MSNAKKSPRRGKHTTGTGNSATSASSQRHRKPYIKPLVSETSIDHQALLTDLASLC